MRLASLFSGGKDSMMALYLMEQQGHQLPYLVNVVPSRSDSWVFHTPNLHLLPLHAESMGKELVQVEGGEDEAQDLASLEAALSSLDVDGVVTGAVASDYQWDRVNRVCEGLGLKTLSPLWRKGQSLLMEEILDAGIDCCVVAVMAEGLDGGWLGRRLDRAAVQELERLADRHGINVAGEGGEYETLVLDSPLHSRPLQLGAAERSMGRDSGSLRVTDAHLGARKDSMNSRRPM